MKSSLEAEFQSQEKGRKGARQSQGGPFRMGRAAWRGELKHFMLSPLPKCQVPSAASRLNREGRAWMVVRAWTRRRLTRR